MIGLGEKKPGNEDKRRKGKRKEEKRGDATEIEGGGARRKEREYSTLVLGRGGKQGNPN